MTAQSTDVAWRWFTVDTTAPAVTIKGRAQGDDQEEEERRRPSP